MTSRGNDRGAGGTGGGREALRRDRRLVRFLHGELAPAERSELEGELGRDPALAARLGELERLWRALEPPAEEPGAAGEGARLARAMLERDRERERRGRWLGGLAGGDRTPAPAWARPLVAGALAAGLAVGFWSGQPAARRAVAGGERASTVAVTAPIAGPEPAVAPAPGPVPAATDPREASPRSARPPAEERVAGAGRGPSSPGAASAAPEPAREAIADDRDELATFEPALAGEPTLAEAYLMAMESEDWGLEGSGP